MDFRQIYTSFKEQKLSGRYIHSDDITPLLISDFRKSNVSIIGHSVLQRPIYAYRFGTGNISILMWSQMHGNESTSTKALFDLFNFLESDEAVQLLKSFSFCIVPLLNPDGAVAYTRANANDVDLNRDFVQFSQPESLALQNLYKAFKPQFCYNLHDQRTIFGVGNTKLPATISFLAPAYNANRDINDNRSAAINVIAAMNSTLQQLIPGQVGRFDDSFNINCAGDHFQNCGTPTILIEAGHYQNDYQREQTRQYFFIALLAGLMHISENDVVEDRKTDYLAIPQNYASFYDIVYKNVRISYDGNEFITNFAAQYKEELIDGVLQFNAYISEIGLLEQIFGHVEYDAAGSHFWDGTNFFPTIDQKADFQLGVDTKVVNGLVTPQ
ncbi:MAG TPA: M14 family zinc carboxypeptidase [Flavobacterium sp.]|jgi:hypothetical protein|nr:M14 family zinc carboxypeptidase [Flavobacterium sp.]